MEDRELMEKELLLIKGKTSFLACSKLISLNFAFNNSFTFSNVNTSSCKCPV